jgi:hypothetical protein
MEVPKMGDTLGLLGLAIIMFIISFICWKLFWGVIGLILGNKVIRTILLIVGLIILVIWLISSPAMRWFGLAGLCIVLFMIMASIMGH